MLLVAFRVGSEIAGKASPVAKILHQEIREVFTGGGAE
jgi:hypothetical protein